MYENFVNEKLGVLQNNFNGLTLKKRVEMITNTKSKKIKALKYALIIPVFAILSFAFSKNSTTVPIVNSSITNIKKSGNPSSIFPIKEGDYKKISVGFEGFFNPIKKKTMQHGGIDIVADEGTGVIATTDGIVATVEFKEGWGNLIIIKHDKLTKHIMHI